jgi:hypothetical protein
MCKRVRTLRQADRLLGQVRLNGWADRLGQKLRLRRWRRETLFNNKAYGNSLQEMHRLTLELMPLTQEVLQQATASLADLQQTLCSPACVRASIGLCRTILMTYATTC